LGKKFQEQVVLARRRKERDPTHSTLAISPARGTSKMQRARFGAIRLARQPDGVFVRHFGGGGNGRKQRGLPRKGLTKGKRMLKLKDEGSARFVTTGLCSKNKHNYKGKLYRPAKGGSKGRLYCDNHQLGSRSLPADKGEGCVRSRTLSGVDKKVKGLPGYAGNEPNAQESTCSGRKGERTEKTLAELDKTGTHRTGPSEIRALVPEKKRPARQGRLFSSN